MNHITVIQCMLYSPIAILWHTAKKLFQSLYWDWPVDGTSGVPGSWLQAVRANRCLLPEIYHKITLVNIPTDDEKNQLDATNVIYSHKLTLHVSSIYMLIFRSSSCNLLHLVFRTVRENKVIVIGLCCSVYRVVIGVGMHNTLQPAPHPHLTPAVPLTPVRTIRSTLFQYTQPRSLHQLLRDTPNNTDRSLMPYFLLQCGIPNAVSYNLYSWRWAYKCSKHVEFIYENKLHWLHQVGSSRHCSIRCTVTHTSNTDWVT
jgi:hypothetical protein